MTDFRQQRTIGATFIYNATRTNRAFDIQIMGCSPHCLGDALDLILLL